MVDFPFLSTNQKVTIVTLAGCPGQDLSTLLARTYRSLLHGRSLVRLILDRLVRRLDVHNVVAPYEDFAQRSRESTVDVLLRVFQLDIHVGIGRA